MLSLEAKLLPLLAPVRNYLPQKLNSSIRILMNVLKSHRGLVVALINHMAEVCNAKSGKACKYSS